MPWITAAAIMKRVDWNRGLPEAVLPLMANLGGVKDMKVMRGVSKSWQEGFNLGITSIRISSAEVLPDGLLKGAQHFPELTRLDLRDLRVPKDTTLKMLQALQTFPKLDSLFLGSALGSLPSEHLPITLRELRGMQLKLLDLSGCNHLSDAALTECTHEMQLSSLVLSGCCKLTPAGLECLRGMSLFELDLGDCFSSAMYSSQP